VRTDSFENPSIVHDSNSDNEECHRETEDSNSNRLEILHEVEDIKTNDEINLTTQRNDKRVRFTLPTSEDGESREDCLGSTEENDSANKQPVSSDGISESVAERDDVAEGDGGDFIISHSSVPDKTPVEQLHQMGYTQLRELKCSLETRLGSKSSKH